jgi:hypothetical protein
VLLLGVLDRSQGGGTGRLAGHRDRAEVEDRAILNQLVGKLGRLEEQVGAGITVEGEGTVASGAEMDESERRITGIGHDQAVGGDSDIIEGLFQELAKLVGADFADESRRQAELGQCGQDIGRAPPGFCSKVGLPWEDGPAGVKSIRSSPRAVTSYMTVYLTT